MRTNKGPSSTWKIHPGEILREEFLRPMGMSANELARSIYVPAPRINDIVLERRGGHRGYRCQTGSFLWHVRGILDEFAVVI